jgi:hypothetical protein
MSLCIKGPGGSGGGWISGSEAMSTIVEGRYDIIGFDPRYVVFHRELKRTQIADAD